MDLYLSAEEAADALGISVSTLYTYVSRKGIRSQKLPGTRERRYWLPDIERIRAKERPSGSGFFQKETDITLLTSEGHFYRGESALKLSETQTLEEVAALLWQVDVSAAFNVGLPSAPSELRTLNKVLPRATSSDKAIATFPFLEQANPGAFDLTHVGMCRSGAEVLRWYAAILAERDGPSLEPLHLQVAHFLNAGDEVADLIRRLLVLSADHGFRAGAYAVRAVASTGVSPYRSVLAGLAIANGRRTQFGRVEAMRRMLEDIRDSRNPRSVVLSRLQEGDRLPGFDTLQPYAGASDPRAERLLMDVRRVFGTNELFKKVEEAIVFVEDRMQQKPSFALVNTLLSNLIGLPSTKQLYLLGRCAGWIAHSIEQYQAGPIEPSAVTYVGSLPKPDEPA